MNKTKVFYAGKQPDYTYSNEDVRAIAEAYTETNYSAPWVCGHEAKSGDQAMGWVRSLEYTEENGVGELWANTDFNEMGQSLIDGGLYENKSISFYTPESPFNPAPGQWSVRHIAMLGAEPPVLKNLGPIAVIDYSEEDSAFVSYSCGCNSEPDNIAEIITMPRDFKKEYAELQQKMQLLEKEMSETIVEPLTEEPELYTPNTMTALDIVTAERDALLAQLNASKEANTMLSVSSAVSPYYSEGILTDDVLSEATLTSVITKLTLGVSNFSEEETPIVVIEKLLQALLGSKIAEPEYGEKTIQIDTPAQTVSYSDGDELHALATKTASTYGLSYGQALSAVVMAQETSTANKVNFSESLAEAVNGFKV